MLVCGVWRLFFCCDLLVGCILWVVVWWLKLSWIWVVLYGGCVRRFLSFMVIWWWCMCCWLVGFVRVFVMCCGLLMMVRCWYVKLDCLICVVVLCGVCWFRLLVVVLMMLKLCGEEYFWCMGC